MAQRAWVATRKGLFELRQRAAAWAIERVSFLGEPVSMLLPPQPSGRMFAALNLGHFGVKVHASDDAGVSWNELAAPAYSPQPEGDQCADCPGTCTEQRAMVSRDGARAGQSGRVDLAVLLQSGRQQRDSGRQLRGVRLSERRHERRQCNVDGSVCVDARLYLSAHPQRHH